MHNANVNTDWPTNLPNSSTSFYMHSLYVDLLMGWNLTRSELGIGEVDSDAEMLAATSFDFENNEAMETFVAFFKLKPFIILSSVKVDGMAQIQLRNEFERGSAPFNRFHKEIEDAKSALLMTLREPAHNDFGLTENNVLATSALVLDNTSRLLLEVRRALTQFGKSISSETTYGSATNKKGGTHILWVK